MKEEESRHCPRCRSLVAPQAVFCTCCGCEMRAVDRGNASASAHRTIAPIIIALLMAFTAGGAFYFWRKAGASPTPRPVADASVTNAPRPAVPRESWGEFKSRSGFSGSLYDLLVHLCLRDSKTLSIDPAVQSVLASTSVTLTDYDLAQDSSNLVSRLCGSSRLVIVTSLVSSNEVDVITTSSFVTYSRALAAIQNNQLSQALTVLNSRTPDGSDYDRHCDELKPAVRALLEMEARFQIFERILDTSSRNYTGAREESKKVLSELLSKQIVAFWEAFGTRQHHILKRLHTSIQEGLTGESAILAGRITRLLDWSARVERKLVAAGLVNRETWASTTEAAGLFGEMHTRERAAVARASSATLAAVSAFPKVDRSGLQRLAGATSMDPTLPQARIALGYATHNEHVAGLRALFRESAGRSLATIRSEYAGPEGSLWTTVIDQRDRATGQAAYNPPRLIGSVRAAIVDDGEGKVVPLIVSAERMEPTKITYSRTLRTGFMVAAWDGMVYADETRRAEIETWTKTPMFQLAQFRGEPGDGTWEAAYQACLWLKREAQDQYPDNKSLRIQQRGFHLAEDDDSLGLAIGIAGESALLNAPVRQDIAVTGAVRPDGTIGRSGDMGARALGALLAVDVPILIAPADNESDLAMLSSGHLCRQVIILAGCMADVRKFALNPSDNNGLIDMAEAIVDLKRGEWGAAYERLQVISDKHPQIYNARRLLWMLRQYGKGLPSGRGAGLATTTTWGSPLRSASDTAKIASFGVCQSCAGKGFSGCTKCSGRGSLDLVVQFMCPNCNGEGYIRVSDSIRSPCLRCSSRARISETVLSSCDACGGAGVLVCPGCHGMGVRE